ncbi:MAG: 8-amino-7-oxononanoate synthase [Byssovorax sp.]
MSERGPLRHLEQELAHLEARGLLRSPTAAARPGPALLNLCSNDYLGYAGEPWSSAQPWGAAGERGNAGERGGAGASRLVSGNDPAHEDAEAALAAWVGTESALLFSSGYAANLGTIAALAGPGDVLFSDAYNHASIIDGCRLSGAKIRVIPHLDHDALARALGEERAARRRWVVTESYFSMDGDSPDLRRLRALADEHDAALLVDEAHALGVFGPSGRGLAAEAGVQPDVTIGTGGKALGLQGAFVLGSATLRTWLWNRARSFVFSTGLSPLLGRALAARVARASADESGRARLRENEIFLRKGLAELGLEGVEKGRGPVIPWVLGEPAAALDLSRRLREHGVLVQAIRPPTVPPGTARLRITVHAGLGPGDLHRALTAFRASL